MSQSQLEQQFSQPVSSPWPVAPTQEEIQAQPLNVDNIITTNAFSPTSIPQNTVWNKPETSTDITRQESVTVNHSVETSSQLPEEDRSVPSIPHDQTSETVVPTLTSEKVSEHKGAKLAPTLAISTSVSKSATSAKQTTARETATEKKDGAATASTPQKKSSKSPQDSTTVPTPPQQAPKSAWGIAEESRSKQQLPSLREIQESERKKQEARKHVELERDRTVRGAVSASEEKTFTTAWGLPSSHATVRPNGAVNSKEGSASPAQTTAPAWTTAAKPVAKTMKEIQEEEERQKRSLKEREAVTAAKRAAAAAPAKVGSFFYLLRYLTYLNNTRSH